MMSVVRKLIPVEERVFLDHLLRLSPEERQQRFAGHVSDEVLRAYVARFSWLDSLLFGWMEEGVLRGTAQLTGFAGTDRAAELALTVEDDWQNRGIGTELCRRALLAAQNRGLATVCMVCLSDNPRMQHIARRLSMTLTHSFGSIDSAIALPFANPLTLMQEVVADSGALVARLTEDLTLLRRSV